MHRCGWPCVEPGIPALLWTEVRRSERVSRPLIFLAVLLLHVMVVVVLIRSAARPISSSAKADEFLVLLVLPRKPVAPPDAVAPPQQVAPRPSPASKPAAARRNPPVPEPKTSVVPEQPASPAPDWLHEAELAARNSVAGAEKDKDYRDLSGMTPERLAWLKQNQMEPARPGIPWNHPRVEISGGIPIIWINDHCISVPAMLFMVFCKIGHIEPDGDLFKHMGDAH